MNKFNHSGIVVQDMEVMTRFYTEELGLTERARFETDASVRGDHTGIPGAKRVLVFLGFDDGHQLELVHYRDPPAHDHKPGLHHQGATHVCFQVDDLATLYNELRAKGVSFVTEPIYDTTPDGDKWGVVYCQDPEGNYLEFIEF